MEGLFKKHVAPIVASSPRDVQDQFHSTATLISRQSQSASSARAYVNDFSKYPYIIIGSGMGGGALARKLMTNGANKGPRVMLFEKGGMRLHTHCLNTSRLHFDHQSQKGRGRDNEAMFDKYLSIHETMYKTEDPDCGGGSVFELGGRSLFWSLETPVIRDDRLTHFFPSKVASDLTGTTKIVTSGIEGQNQIITNGDGWYKKAQRIMANSPPGDDAYPTKYVTTTTVNQITEAEEMLRQALHKVGPHTSSSEPLSTPNGAEFGDSNNLYYFPQNAYNTSDWIQDNIFNQAYGDNQPFCVSLDTPVNGVTVKDGRVSKIDINNTSFNVGRHQKVILCAGTVNTAAIALRSTNLPHAIQHKIGKNLTDHEIWSTRYWRKLDAETYKSQKAIELSCYVTVDGREALLTCCLHAERFYGHGFADGEGGTDAEAEFVGVLNLLFEFEAELNPEGNVTLDKNTNEPVLDIHRGPASPALKAELKKLCKAIREEFGFKSDSGSDGGFDDDLVHREPWGSVAHEVGTMRMDGASDSEGVVDSNLKVKGVDNLFVCDLSVFPVSPMANPSLTMTALAMRLGDHLLGLKSTD